MTALIDVIAPPNEEGTQATILKWGKNVGDSVAKDEPLLELETDKVTVEIPSPVSGELTEILKSPGEDVLPGQVLARVRGGPQNTEIAAAPPAASAPLLSPAVRRLLTAHGIPENQIAGSGRHGRITAQDIERHVEGAKVPVTGSGDPRLPHTTMRKRIAEHMVRSLGQAPHVTTLFEADLGRVLTHRAKHKGDFEGRGARLTLSAYMIAACARALPLHPELNASFSADALELHRDINIGIGTALGAEGLIVPVLHRAQDLDLCGVARRLGQLVIAARANRLVPADVRGGTFTISNHGVSGSLLATPIVINQPQVAILGVGKVERRVCALPIDGAEQIVVRSMCYLTLTIDHRAIDAFQANAFLSSVVATLEQWPED